jgi:hypothetical protein
VNLAVANRREQDALKGKLILDWLLFAPRINFSEQRALRAAMTDILGESALDPITALTPRPCADSAELTAYNVFAAHVESSHLAAENRSAREDVRAIFAEISASDQSRHDPQIGLIALLRQIIRLFGIEIYIESRSVRVSLNSLAGWYQVTDRLDAEALLCLKLAEFGFAEEVAALDRWSLVTPISDRDLDGLVSSGVSDMHQHLGGLRSPHVIWLQLMAGRVATDQISYFDRATMDALTADPAAHRARIIERERIERLAAAHLDGCNGHLWRYFFKPLAQLRDCAPPWPQDGVSGGPDAEAIEELVLRERVMLARGFARLIALSGSDAGGHRADACRLEHALDLYIHAKSRFISNHRQAVRSNPGLGRHRQFTDSTKIGWERERQQRPPRSAEVQSYEYTEAVYFIAQSPALQRVEMRLAPANVPQDYTRFLEAWELVEERMKSVAAVRPGRALPEMRFSIHFKRSLDRRGGVAQDKRVREFLTELDIYSAALHEFRLDRHDANTGPAGSPIVTRIARIDFAGQERDIFPDRAAFAMNLLRGDEVALGLLDARIAGFQPSKDFHGRWLELKEKERLQTPVTLPRLGVTCHAGEDYAHPLEGIHAMMTAVEALRMRAGDSIGHGLAIGRDVARFHREVAPHVLTTKGAQFDALIWLQHTLTVHAPAEHMHAILRINAWLWRKLMEIYRTTDLQPASLTAFREVARLRRGPIPERETDLDTLYLPAKIWWHECWDPDVQKERLAPEALASVLYDMETTIAWAQDYVAREMAKRGVVIELNPSSNWRISQARYPSEIPFISILLRFGTFIIACVNTDNAGAYGTRIENEYAIALFGLMEAGVSRTEAITLLDRLRVAGLSRLH